MTGTIKKKTDRGFGFIALDGEDKDVFFHSTALVGVTFDALQEGAAVTFDVEDGENGRQSAKNVLLAGAGEQQSEPMTETMETQDAEPMAENAPADAAASAEEPEKV